MTEYTSHGLLKCWGNFIHLVSNIDMQKKFKKLVNQIWFMITNHGLIKEAKLCSIYDLWKKKPKRIGNDTDVIVIKVKTADKEVKEMFFTCLKADGTFYPKAATKLSQVRRNRLAQFLKYYFNVENPESYNVKESIKDWLGAQVRIENDSVYIP